MNSLYSIPIPVRFSVEEQRMIDAARGSIARAAWVREAGLQSFRKGLSTSIEAFNSTPRTLVRQINITADIQKELEGVGPLGRYFHDAAVARAGEVVPGTSHDLVGVSIAAKPATAG